MTEEHDQRREAGAKTISPRMISAGGLAVVLLVFIAQNTGKTTVHFLWTDFSTALWFVIVLAGLVGAGVTYLIQSRRRRHSA